ncbi:MAG: EMC3/TMCO1 family protein [archaeon]
MRLEMIISPAGYEVAAIAVIGALISSIINKKLVNRDRTEFIQERVKELQKEMNEALKKDPKADISGKNAEIMALMKEQMSMSFKPMMYTAIPFIIVLSAVGIRYGPAGFVVSGVPLFNNLGWLGWYILVSLITTIIIETAYSQYRKAKKRKQKEK